MKLLNPERLFGLDEEIDRRLLHVKSLCLIREDRYVQEGCDMTKFI